MYSKVNCQNIQIGGAGSLRDKWFSEKEVPGKRFRKIKHSFFIKKLIYKGKTPFQKVLIFDNPVYGRVFCLDDIVQLSQSDEFIYHEMMTHPVLFSHPNPENILIIGGGDGGVLREILKHPVKKVGLAEIDKKIIEISKKYLKFVCQNSFSDKRVEILNLAGEKLIKTHKGAFDIILIDCTNPEPEGFSVPLYSATFYQNIFNALRRDGMVITLGASFLDFNFINTIYKRLGRFFPSVAIYRFCMPSYHCGEYSFIAASKKINLHKIDFRKIKERIRLGKYKFRHYSPEIHRSSTILPPVYQETLLQHGKRK